MKIFVMLMPVRVWRLSILTRASKFNLLLLFLNRLMVISVES